MGTYVVTGAFARIRISSNHGASREKARRSALKRLVSTFFQGSVTQAMAALLEDPDTDLPEPELQRLEQLIKQARKQGR